MRACFTLFLTFRLFLSAFAQENELTISGRIADEKNNPIPYASIALLTQGDSTMAGGVVTDEAGTFQLQARKGKYILKITFLSFKE
ncbi:MAG TPA: carboxypeptidase-like regulatory domain-containing protein, partial [Sphingobacteriaceae bacterium]